MDRDEMRKNMEMKMWRIKFWESFHIVPSAFDVMNEYNPEEVRT
jgi:hypothetical protein